MVEDEKWEKYFRLQAQREAANAALLEAIAKAIGAKLPEKKLPELSYDEYRFVKFGNQYLVTLYENEKLVHAEIRSDIPLAELTKGRST